MRLLFYDDFKLGVLNGDNVMDVTSVVQDIPHSGPGDLISGLIANFDQYRERLQEAAAMGSGVPLSSVRVRPPLPSPKNIACMAVNYMENGTLPQAPPINAFLKSPSAIIGDGETMILPDVPATIFEGEAELGLIIGKHALNVSQAEAKDYIFGYTNFIDGSARGLLPAGNTFFQMKSRQTYAPVGPIIVTADEVPDPQNLQVQLWNNGVLMQDYNTNDMAHNILRSIEWVSSVQSLEPGDILAMGTNHRGLNPFMDGDKIEIEIEGLGRLHFGIRDDLKRTWARETRLERREKGMEGPTPQLTGKYAPEK